MVSRPVTGLQAEVNDSVGVTALREAAEVVAAAAEDVRALTGADTPVLAIAVISLRRAIEVLEQLCDRQLSAALLLMAGNAGIRPSDRAARPLHLVR